MLSVKKQRGVTAVGWLIILALIGFFTLVTLKLLPIYIDGFSVTSALESLKNEHNVSSKSPAEIKNMIMKRLDINMVTDVERENIFIERSGGMMTVEIEYEVRKPMMGNVDIVVTYNNKVEFPAN